MKSRFCPTWTDQPTRQPDGFEYGTAVGWYFPYYLDEDSLIQEGIDPDKLSALSFSPSDILNSWAAEIGAPEFGMWEALDKVLNDRGLDREAVSFDDNDPAVCDPADPLSMVTAVAGPTR
ncbi:hypothetical protein [Bifidobacterium aerophilum]|uniref:hypothetical protein n=1 Tax=Bifidobacterium aerophilum TaxID=1798155 RepID=UPI0013D35440|nr:hypothetical protein [Bifidobacterium aerophilum]